MHRDPGCRSLAMMQAAFTFLVLLFVAYPAAADDQDGQRQLTDEQRARLEARMEEIRSRLDLSDVQKAQLEPVLRKDLETRAEVLRRHGMTREGGERPGRREMRAIRQELKTVREATDAEVERILDARQLAEYRKIQDEARDEMRERLRSRSSGNE
jgi:hypothetical protein